MGRAQTRSLVSRPLIRLKTPLKETSATKARLCRRVISYLTSWRVTVGDIAESCDIRTPSGNAKSSSRTTQETRTSYCFTRLLHISLTIDRSYCWRPACGLKTREGRILARVFKTRALQNVQQTFGRFPLATNLQNQLETANESNVLAPRLIGDCQLR